MASVPVKYIEVDSLTGVIKSTVPLEMSGGIAGYMANENDCMSFHIGWTVNKSDEEKNIERLKQLVPFGVTV